MFCKKTNKNRKGQIMKVESGRAGLNLFFLLKVSNDRLFLFVYGHVIQILMAVNQNGSIVRPEIVTWFEIRSGPKQWSQTGIFYQNRTAETI